ncbi:hypothetical protein HN51_023247 [Arachis hypogaea]
MAERTRAVFSRVRQFRKHSKLKRERTNRSGVRLSKQRTEVSMGDKTRNYQFNSGRSKECGERRLVMLPSLPQLEKIWRVKLDWGHWKASYETHRRRRRTMVEEME